MNHLFGFQRLTAAMTPFLLALGLALAGAADATPQFAAEYKQACHLCHVSPSGAGMRSLYGAQFFSNMELPMKGMTDFAELENIQPNISKNLQVGYDFRSIYYSYDLGEDSSGNSFLTMQGDLYLLFQPAEKVSLYVDHNLRQLNEGFVLWQGLPYLAQLRVGQFVPSYGWRFEDHKSYVQEKLGFNPANRGNTLIPDSGVEFGFYPMDWEASVALTNGSFGFVDYNQGKTVTARAMLRKSLGKFNASLGSSYRYGDPGIPAGLLRYAGVFWALNRSALTYMGEVDWMTSSVKGLVATNLVTWRMKKGWYISGQYDYYDPELDRESGFQWRGRLSSEMFLRGYLALIPALEWNYNEGSAGIKQEYGSAELQLHFWY